MKAVLSIFLLASSVLAAGATHDDLQDWLNWEKEVSVRNLLANISPDGAAKGAVVASPSKDNPNYFKHWIRDAGLTMDVVISMYQMSHDPGERNSLFNRMADYMDFSRRNQETGNPSGGLGEPLFWADGSAYNLGWARPQNDSPAIRAYVLSRWAQVLLSEGKSDIVWQKLYRPEIPAYTVIKSDLEYTAHHFDESCFDLWEEVRGFHFYTRMVQRRAMKDGAALAERMGDFGAAEYYRSQARVLEDRITTHFDPGRQYIVSTLGRDGGLDYKSSNLDASVILAVMHGDTSDGFFAPTDDRVMSTALHLSNQFRDLYPINQVGVGVGIGRYPEDRYDGLGGGQGNPWVLLTNAFGQYYYRVAHGFESRGDLTITDLNAPFFRAALPSQAGSLNPGRMLHRGDSLFKDLVAAVRHQGDDYLRRVKYHTGPDGNLSEQMNRYTGFMQGAYNLTWSDASLITAAWDR
jgi:glucoamylase